MEETVHTANQQSQTFKKETVKPVLLSLFDYYDYRCDLDALLHETPHLTGESEIHYIKRFISKQGFHVSLENARKKNKTEIKHPFISMDIDKKFKLTMPQRIFNSDKTTKNDVTLDGEILIIKPESGNVFYSEHMERGHTLDWFWKPLMMFRKSYVDVLFATIFINLFVLLIPLYSLNIYDRVITSFAYDTLKILTIGVFVAFTFDFIFRTVRAYILENIVENVGNEYDFRLMDRLMEIKKGAAQRDLSIGEKANLFRELQAIREFYATKFVPTLVDFPFILLFVSIIYLFSPTLALVLICVACVMLAINVAAHIPIGRLTQENFSTLQNKTGYLIETLSGIDTLKMYNARSHRLFHWDLNVQKTSRSLRQNNFLMAILSNTTFMINQTCHILIIYFGVFEIEKGDLTIGGLITCTILSSRAIAPVINMSSIVARFRQTSDVLKAIDTIFKIPHEQNQNQKQSLKNITSHGLKLDRVAYNYPDSDRTILDTISIEIKDGEKVGIIGSTAAGKSTLAQIIAGVLKPETGGLQLDGFDYSSMAVTQLRRTISYAPQDSYFFKGSVLYNITLGREDLTQDDIETAVTVSGLGIALKQSGSGLDADIGEMGEKLSGGQKQALILARAIVRKSKVLILDEPTNAMDSGLENYVSQSLKTYVADKTFIMITHRTSLLNLVDRLILIDQGRIVADGSRDKILAELSQKKQ